MHMTRSNNAAANRSERDLEALVRAGIRALLERIPDTEVVAEASDGREAVELDRKSVV